MLSVSLNKTFPFLSFQIIKELIKRKQEQLQKVYPGLSCFKDGVRQIPIESIPGVTEAGWKPSPEKEKRFKIFHLDNIQ